MALMRMLGIEDDSEKSMESMSSMGSRGEKASSMTTAEFIRQMIPHHKSAIQMAKAYLSGANQNPRITAIAKNILTSQQKEIDEMQDVARKESR